MYDTISDSVNIFRVGTDYTIMTQALYSLNNGTLKLPLLFGKSYLITMAKASKNSDKNTDTGIGIQGKQEVSSVWCENARANNGENPEITIPKSEF